jgi:hypothetical protein
MDYQVNLTLKSRNAKVGPIPVSTSTNKTCPNSCPLKKAGCYADAGPLGIFWSKVSKGAAGSSWQAFCDAIAALPEGQLWRHNQAGDLPGDGEKIDRKALDKLVAANAGKRGFTYTHYEPKGANATAISKANGQGFTVNLSANNLNHADKLAALGVGPVVSIVPEDYPDQGLTLHGRRVVVCPEQTGRAVSCEACGLCQKQTRGVIVGFRSHGRSKRKVDALARG